MAPRAFGAAPLFLAPLLGALASGCGKPATSLDADPARKAAPLAACVVRLPARKSQGFMRQLTDDQYLKLVFPSYEAPNHNLPDGARVCTGEPIFDDTAFAGTKRRAFESEDTPDLVFGGGANRIKVLWIKSHVRPDGDVVGALALVRTLENRAEVYAVGTYRGNGKNSRLGLERMGSELLVTALDDRCTGRKPNEPCDTTLVVYLPWAGRLKELAKVPLERVRFADNAEPGASGPVEYSLVTSPSFEEGGIRLFEQVIAKDAEGRELRKAERERVYRWRDGEVTESDPSIWGKMFVLMDGTKPASPPGQ